MKHAEIMRFKIVTVFLLVDLTDILYQLRQPEVIMQSIFTGVSISKLSAMIASNIFSIWSLPC